MSKLEIFTCRCQLRGTSHVSGSPVFFFLMHIGHARIQRGSNFDNVFFYYYYFVLFFRGGRILIPLLAGHRSPNIECWLCDLRGSGPVLLRNPIFCNFPGGGSGSPVPTPIWIRTCWWYSLLKSYWMCDSKTSEFSNYGHHHVSVNVRHFGH